MTEYEKQVEKLVDLLGCSIFEAEQIIADDKKINKGEQVNFGLSKEEEKKALKYADRKAKTAKKPMALNLTKRERKPDTTKEGLIQSLYEFLSSCNYEQVEITNKTKMIAFKLDGDMYELNLVRKRKK